MQDGPLSSKWNYFLKIDSEWEGLTHKQLEMLSGVISIIATDALVLKQPTCIHNAVFLFNSSLPGQNVLNANVWISIKISLKFVP